MSVANYDVKEQVRDALSIVDVVGSYLDLRREGRNFTALCPWHHDSRPSLKINPDRQSWKCWVCDDGGDIFSFVMKREGVTFREALELLADRANIPLRSRGPRAEEGTASHKPTLFRAMAWAEQQFAECLQRDASAQAAREYLLDRGIDPGSQQRFHLGFAPDSWDWLIQRAAATPFDASILSAVGLILKSEKSNRYYDRFRQRIIFSIRDPQNRPIGFGGRILPNVDEQAKYINSPETRLFSKSDNVYGLDLARDSVSRDRHVVIVEGYTDVIMCHQNGIENVVAVLGTALGPRHIRLLRRFADRVTLVLDGDEAGQRRTNEVLEMFVASPLDLRIVTLPEGQDPCDFVRGHGREAFESLLGQSDDALTHKINLATRGVDLVNDIHQSNRALEEILSTLAGATLAGESDNNPWRLRLQQVLGRLAREFRVGEASLRERLRELRKSKRPLAEQFEESPAAASKAEFDPWDRELLWLVFRYPHCVDEALDRIDAGYLRSEPAREIWNIYQSLRARGLEADFGRVLAEVEDPRLKSMMVEVDEARIQSPALPQECLEQLIEAYHARETVGACQQQVAKLENSNLTDDEQLDALTEILNQQRRRQGISAPTDG